MGMAEENFVPEIFAYRHPTQDTPVVALIFGALLLLCASSFNFLQIVAVDNVLNCFSVIMELGKYSKRRRSNVAVIHVRIIFTSSILFYCLLLNHSFQTNPNSITNCFKLFLSIYNFTNYICSMRFVYFDF
jgi:amino acid transporter